MNQNLASDTNFTFLVSLSPGLGPLQNITEKTATESYQKNKKKNPCYTHLQMMAEKVAEDISRSLDCLGYDLDLLS